MGSAIPFTTITIPFATFGFGAIIALSVSPAAWELFAMHNDGSDCRVHQVLGDGASSCKHHTMTRHHLHGYLAIQHVAAVAAKLDAGCYDETA